MTEVLLGYTTAPDGETARAIARMLVEKKLVACANILGSCESVFWWEGCVAQEQELPIVFKTHSIRAKEIAESIREMHPYDCPCLVFLPIFDGDPAFLQWISEQCGSSR